VNYKEYMDNLNQKKENAEKIKNSIFRELNNLEKFAKENVKEEEVNFLGMFEESIEDMKDDVKDLIEKMFYIINRDKDKPNPPNIMI
jgi:plasmid replication initiation protein